MLLLRPAAIAPTEPGEIAWTAGAGYLAGAFVPLFFGAFWRRATTQGALTAIFGGLSSWILVETLVGEASLVPPQLIGLGVSILGMVVGSLLPPWIGHRLPVGRREPRAGHLEPLPEGGEEGRVRRTVHLRERCHPGVLAARYGSEPGLAEGYASHEAIAVVPEHSIGGPG